MVCISPVLVIIMMKICVIIPCFNVAKTIGNIVKGIKKQAIDTIIIDDGSTDTTVETAAGLEAIILRNKTNKGKGASLRAGFEYALNNGYDKVITMDGDGQHSPDDIRKFLQVMDNAADIIVGNRMNSASNMPIIRRITNKVMSGIISIICRQNIPDSQSGFRLIKSSSLRNLKLKSNRFEIESEVLLEAAKGSYKIFSIPVSSIYNNATSRINPFLDTYRFLRFILPYIKSYILR